MKKILITGCSGFLGSRLACYYKDMHELLLPSHSDLNVCREDMVMSYLDKHHPDIVVHCAALSNTWFCEQHPEESYRVNVQSTATLAKACKRIGAKLIFMSSDQVYNGTHVLGPLREGQEQKPSNVYGRHKQEAEQRTLINNQDAVGLRLTWMYDLPESKMKLNTNILVNLKKAYDEGTTIRAATHEYRGVTYVWEVVKNLGKTFSLPGGIYNFGSENSLNTYELFVKAANLMGLKEPCKWIIPDDERFSEQPRNLIMDCSSIERYGIYFDDSLVGIEQALQTEIPNSYL